jgi:LmbE family N-acetylglucosaminyl deacetylase
MAERLTLMAVHAHPDDECIGTGGCLARYNDEGGRAVLVTATYGEEGEIVDPEMHAEEIRPKLGDVRIEELRCACKVLGIRENYFLGYRDSGMAGTPANQHPECFAQADLAEATGRMVRLIRDVRPHVVTCSNEYGGYGHPDHIQVNRVTVAAFHAAGNPTQYPELGLPPGNRKSYTIRVTRVPTSSPATSCCAPWGKQPPSTVQILIRTRSAHPTWRLPRG